MMIKKPSIHENDEATYVSETTEMTIVSENQAVPLLENGQSDLTATTTEVTALADSEDQASNVEFSEFDQLEREFETVNELNLLPGQLTVPSKKGSQAPRIGYKPDTMSQKIYDYIFSEYGLRNPFLTEELYQHFKKEGLRSSDVGGQLYSLKKQGILECDDPSEEQAQAMRKSCKVWQLVKERPTNE